MININSKTLHLIIMAYHSYDDTMNFIILNLFFF